MAASMRRRRALVLAGAAIAVAGIAVASVTTPSAAQGSGPFYGAGALSTAFRAEATALSHRA